MQRLSSAYRSESCAGHRCRIGPHGQTVPAGLPQKVPCRSRHQIGGNAEPQIEKRRDRSPGCIHQQTGFENKRRGATMKTKLLFISPALLMFFFAAVVLPKPDDRLDVTAHEWGTFTSVAGEDGMPVPWFSYTGPLDLPCFVYNFGGPKILIRGTVRMETPVLYFYSSRESSVNVKVSFPQGTITEWYPQASQQRRSNNLIQWQDVKISPEAMADFPTERGASHYYAARETDAAALRVKAEREKFLFYRGIGTFPLPLSARFEQEGKLVIRNLGGTPVDGLIVFDNHAGIRRYALAGTVKDEVTVDFESLQDNWAGLLMDL